MGNHRARTQGPHDRSPEIRTLVGVSSGYRANDHRVGADPGRPPFSTSAVPGAAPSDARSWA